jgi:ABC-type amino acid transport substrate-binding protein
LLCLLLARGVPELAAAEISSCVDVDTTLMQLASPSGHRTDVNTTKTTQATSKMASKATHATSKTTYRLGTNVYSPYTFRDGSGGWTGFGVEMARGMSSMCDDITIEIVETPWPDCWLYDDSGIGAALDQETVDACITYTHTHGVRNVYADFGWGVL